MLIELKQNGTGVWKRANPRNKATNTFHNNSIM